MRTLGKPSWGSICFNSDKVEVSMIVLLPVLSDNMEFILILDARAESLKDFMQELHYWKNRLLFKVLDFFKDV